MRRGSDFSKTLRLIEPGKRFRSIQFIARWSGGNYGWMVPGSVLFSEQGY